MERRSKLDTVLKVAQIGALVAVMAVSVALLAAIPGLRRQAEVNLRVARLVHLKELNALIEESRRHDAKIKVFLDRIPGPDGACPAGANCLPAPGTMFETMRSNGRDMYYSEEMKEFVAIGRVYEDLGALIRLGYGDFDFAYTLLNFPDRFWDRTAGYRRMIQDNWNGPGQPLPDFWNNFSWLRDEYLKERRRTR